ncbi:MAG: efflux RND transporter periplasmic adaptor subunit [Pseudomonadota bacterium]
MAVIPSHRPASGVHGRRDGRAQGTRRVHAALVLLLAVAGMVGLASLLAPSSAQDATNAPPPSVLVAPVVSKAISVTSEFTGRVEAIQSVDVQARVEGYLEKVGFEEGTFVKVGDLLYQIEQAPYQADVAQAEAQLAAANASLASANAALRNQEINLQRQQTLVERDTVSQAVLDDATTARDSAQANVQAAEAQIKEAQANLASAKLNLSYTTLRAPIDGRIGKTDVTAGNLISTGSGTMATLVQLDPIRIAFSVPDRLYNDLVERAGNADVSTTRGLFTPTVQLPNGKMYDEQGEIAFASNEIDPSTGTITAYANFANPHGMLLPGAFVVVFVAEAGEASEPSIPASALLQDRDGPYVFVLNTDDVVEVRRITVANRSPTEIAVSEGLSEGETVVVEGVQKIRPGQKVSPQPAPTSPASSQNAAAGSGAVTGSTDGTTDASAAPEASSSAAPSATSSSAAATAASSTEPPSATVPSPASSPSPATPPSAAPSSAGTSPAADPSAAPANQSSAPPASPGEAQAAAAAPVQSLTTGLTSPGPNTTSETAANSTSQPEASSSPLSPASSQVPVSPSAEGATSPPASSQDPLAGPQTAQAPDEPPLPHEKPTATAAATPTTDGTTGPATSGQN